MASPLRADLSTWFARAVLYVVLIALQRHHQTRNQETRRLHDLCVLCVLAMYSTVLDCQYAVCVFGHHDGSIVAITTTGKAATLKVCPRASYVIPDLLKLNVNVQHGTGRGHNTRMASASFCASQRKTRLFGAFVVVRLDLCVVYVFGACCLSLSVPELLHPQHANAHSGVGPQHHDRSGVCLCVVMRLEL